MHCSFPTLSVKCHLLVLPFALFTCFSCVKVYKFCFCFTSQPRCLSMLPLLPFLIVVFLKFIYLSGDCLSRGVCSISLFITAKLQVK